MWMLIVGGIWLLCGLMAWIKSCMYMGKPTSWEESIWWVVLLVLMLLAGCYSIWWTIAIMGDKVKRKGHRWER